MENGKIILDIMLSEPSGEWTCAIDARRDYGRTVMNHQKVPYELVCFLILPVQSGVAVRMPENKKNIPE